MVVVDGDNLALVEARNLATRTCLALLVVAVALVASGCSLEEEYNNDPKPPRVLTMSVLLTNSEIAVSPISYGAGPTRMIVGNKSDVTQVVTIEGVRLSRAIKLLPGNTQTFKAITYPGPLTVDASNTTALPVEVTVGPKRPTAQNDLLQP